MSTMNLKTAAMSLASISLIGAAPAFAYYHASGGSGYGSASAGHYGNSSYASASSTHYGANGGSMTRTASGTATRQSQWHHFVFRFAARHLHRPRWADGFRQQIDQRHRLRWLDFRVSHHDWQHQQRCLLRQFAYHLCDHQRHRPITAIITEPRSTLAIIRRPP